jgi:hypothetical protein
VEALAAEDLLSGIEELGSAQVLLELTALLAPAGRDAGLTVGDRCHPVTLEQAVQWGEARF